MDKDLRNFLLFASVMMAICFVGIVFNDYFESIEKQQIEKTKQLQLEVKAKELEIQTLKLKQK